MNQSNSRPLISFGTFAVGSGLLVLAWLAHEHYASWWPFALAVPLAIVVNVVGMFSPGGSIFKLFAWSEKPPRK